MEKYSHLSLEERKEIYRQHKTGSGIDEIALKIGRDPSTISRELRRNSSDIGYLPDTAQKKYQTRRTHRKKKIVRSIDLKDYVVEKLRLHWSPEQISGRMKLEGKSFYASHETIYQFIYGDAGKNLALYHLLRYKQARRGQIYGRKHHSEIIKDRVSIHQRPLEFSSRLSIGDFEGDLTFFHGNKSANLTVLVDRMSRLTMLVKNMSKHSVDIINGIVNRIQNQPCRSITFDNGSEFARHTRLRNDYGIQTYFCDPGSPWQKGSVENSISRIHRYIPKNGNLLEWSDHEIREIEAKLNNTPRKKLGFLTPFEVFKRQNQGVALQT